jgi:hypothetical protein
MITQLVSNSPQNVGSMVCHMGLLVAIIHHIVRKLPQQPDSALAAAPSLLVGNIACVGVFLLNSTPFHDYMILLGTFSTVFVSHCIYLF